MRKDNIVRCPICRKNASTECGFDYDDITGDCGVIGYNGPCDECPETACTKCKKERPEKLKKEFENMGIVFCE